MEKLSSPNQEHRIAMIGIVVENPESVDTLNDILHDYRQYIIGRMGIPYREKELSIISIALDAPQNIISALSGKVGKLNGVSSKTISRASLRPQQFASVNNFLPPHSVLCCAFFISLNKLSCKVKEADAAVFVILPHLLFFYPLSCFSSICSSTESILRSH